MNNMTTAKNDNPSSARNIVTIFSLCDDTVSNILSYLDFNSALFFTNQIIPLLLSSSLSKSKSCCSDNASDDDNNSSTSSNCTRSYASTWKEIYLRHHFSPLPSTSRLQATADPTTAAPSRTPQDYIHLIQCKLHLLKSLTNKQEEKKQKKLGRHKLMGIPNACFHFIPITPTTFHNHYDNTANNDNIDPTRTNLQHDVPPVDFPCTSYKFTSCNTSSEMVFLDPFHGTISVYNDITEYFVTTKRRNNATIMKKKSEELISIQDYFNIDINEYFKIKQQPYSSLLNHYQQPQHERQQQQQFLLLRGSNTNNNEVIIDWLGIDSRMIIHPATNDHIGNMISGARSIIYEHSDVMMNRVFWNGLDNNHNNNNNFANGHNIRQQEESESIVTEIIAWKKPIQEGTEMETETLYQEDQWICRMNSSPYFIDICPISNRVYTSCTSDVDILPALENNGVVSVVYGSGSDSCNNNCDSNGYGNGSEGYENDRMGVLAYDDGDDSDESLLDVDSPKGSKYIMIYPLLQKNNDENDMISSKYKGTHHGELKYFPCPLECLVCNNTVSSFMIDPLDSMLVVGTQCGTIEIWDVSKSHNIIGSSIQLQIIDMTSELRSKDNGAKERRLEEKDNKYSYHACVAKDANDTTEVESGYCKSQSQNLLINERAASSGIAENYWKEISTEMRTVKSSTSFAANCSEEIATEILTANHRTSCAENCWKEIADVTPMSAFMDSLAVMDANEELTDSSGLPLENDSIQRDAVLLSQCKPHRAFASIEIPNHLSITKSGFVAVSHHHIEGTTLSFFQMDRRLGKGFQLTSLINLPLSPQPIPQVSYDGKRIIVFGQDHIGVIILIYNVKSSPEDLIFQEPIEVSSCMRKHSEDSGGVINFSVPGRVEYANRIRSCGLGGFEYYDNMFMTVNERFIVVNTRTGNLTENEGSRNLAQKCEGLFFIDLNDCEKCTTF